MNVSLVYRNVFKVGDPVSLLQFESGPARCSRAWRSCSLFLACLQAAFAASGAWRSRASAVLRIAAATAVTGVARTARLVGIGDTAGTIAEHLGDERSLLSAVLTGPPGQFRC